MTRGVSEGLVTLSSSVGDTGRGIEAPSAHPEVSPSSGGQSHPGGKGWIQRILDKLEG